MATLIASMKSNMNTSHPSEGHVSILFTIDYIMGTKYKSEKHKKTSI
ncbi:hypothetical protein M917_1778 [Psychrobacter aquaticus CMS 56]|uniref:Uncharacterized protein n=1 Tax=Psychrobacter aquaticus CMS 56 TaxID=1354303 RepID=U4TA25_9GAMM|nr:hypothetical protein M917_1778 [Psychrobacter aquaticus CMS 56]